MKNPIGLYIHVPFCLRKCLYCDFYSVKYDSFTVEKYVCSLIRALKNSRYKSSAVDSVYFGGGTPSLLGSESLSRILDVVAKHFSFTSPEITLEANPCAAGDLDFAALKLAGINRISFGVQSACDNELAALGRPHSAEDAKNCILAANKAGFDNISADLMLGIPYQTPKSLGDSINFLAALPISHISAYMLKVEENTPFANPENTALCPDEDLVAELYLQCVDELCSAGFTQYEISNFAKAGAQSRHNLKYWSCQEYLGLGPAAHSFMDGRRFYIERDLDSFLDAENFEDLFVFDGECGGFDEYAMLRLRLNEGLNLSQAAKLYSIDAKSMLKKAKSLVNSGLVAVNGDNIALTAKGFLLSNTVTARLLY